MAHCQIYRNRKNLQCSPHTHEHPCYQLSKSNKGLYKNKGRACKQLRQSECKGEGRTWGRAGEETASAGDWNMSGRQSGLCKMMEEAQQMEDVVG